MRKFILSVIISFYSIYSFSQCIEGQIKSNKGDTIGYATVYAQSVSKGTTSNAQGFYKLDLPAGNHKITVRYLGYKTKEFTVNCTGGSQKLDIVLQEQLYKIPEVRILASGEDPAYGIMRKAVAMSYYYLNQVEEYDCRVYLKGSGKFDNIPRLMKKTLKKEGLEEGKVMIMESISDLNFQLPDIIEQNVLSMRSTIEGTEQSPMDYVTISLYQDINGLISPLSKDAFAHYKFELLASFYDQDYLVHKIKVIPRREGYDLYSGVIYIVGGFWHLHSAELQIEQKMFKIKWNQVYSPVNNDVWMPISHNFDIEAGGMGFEVKFKYIASVSNYKVKLNSKIDHSLYRNMLVESQEEINEINKILGEQQKEIKELVQKEDLSKKESRKLKKLVEKEIDKTETKKKDLELNDNETYNIEDSASLRSVAYWDSIRPIPLSPDELDSYKLKDSVQLRMETDTTYRDSIEHEEKKFRWSDIFMGGDHRFADAHRFSYGGLIDLGHINYNTVDGLKYGMDLRYSYYNDSTGKYLSIRNNIDYAFARETYTSDMSIYYRYNGLKRASIQLSGGRSVSDFDSETGITENLNLLTTLVLKENYLKLYQKDFVKISHTTDIANGLRLYTGFEYAKRQELINNSDFYLWNPFDNEFTTNIPPVDNFNADFVQSHNASILSINLSYTPEYYYRIRNGVKWNTRSRFPTFKLNYTKGIKGFLDSDVDFDRLDFIISQGISVKRVGALRYKLTAGSFLNSEDLYFADYKHFGTNTPFLMGTSERNTFRLLDFYDYSTNKSYFEVHASVENDRILLKRLPILNKTLMREVVYVNYLASTGNKPYYEVGYGLNQIFLMFNLEVFTGFKGASHEYTGIKIGIPFVGRNGTEVRVGG
jgi:hypothetical protein